MVVDDLVVCGAEPLFLQDYIACGKVVPERIAAIVAGIAEGCAQAGCALVGGETAEHPAPDGRRRVRPRRHRRRASSRPTPSSARSGCAPATCVIAMASSGLALQRLLAGPARAARASPDCACDGHVDGARPRRSARSCSSPTRIYARDCLALIDATASSVHAFAHITGGGLAGNLARVLPDGLDGRARPRHLDAAAPVFRLIASAARVPRDGDGADVQHGRRHGRRGRRRTPPTPRWRCSPRPACPPGSRAAIGAADADAPAARLVGSYR